MEFGVRGNSVFASAHEASVTAWISRPLVLRSRLPYESTSIVKLKVPRDLGYQFWHPVSSPHRIRD